MTDVPIFQRETKPPVATPQWFKWLLRDPDCVLLTLPHEPFTWRSEDFFDRFKVLYWDVSYFDFFPLTGKQRLHMQLCVKHKGGKKWLCSGASDVDAVYMDKWQPQLVTRQDFGYMRGGYKSTSALLCWTI